MYRLFIIVLSATWTVISIHLYVELLWHKWSLTNYINTPHCKKYPRNPWHTVHCHHMQF